MLQPVAISIQDSARAPVDAELQVTPLSQGARVLRALKALGVVWGVAVVAIFIPLVHCVLVPALVVFGLVLAVVRFQNRVLLEATTLACPKCATPVPVEAGTGGWPAKVLCPECSSRLVLAPR